MQSISLAGLLSRWWYKREVVAGLVGGFARADGVMAGMRLQAAYGKCFASARWLGGQGGLSNKAWLRVLHHLVGVGLVEVRRRVRPDGTQGTYEYDWSRLLEWVEQVLREAEREVAVWWPWVQWVRDPLARLAEWLEEWWQEKTAVWQAVGAEAAC